MYKSLLKLGLFGLATILSFLIAIGQTKPKAKPKAKPAGAAASSSNPFGNSSSNPFGSSAPASAKPNSKPSGTGNQAELSSANPFTSSTADPFGGGGAASRDTTKKRKVNDNLPYTVAKAVEGSNPIEDPVRPSLRNDNAVEKNVIKERVPLAYDHIRDDDAVYKQRIWRVIDAREKANLSFNYPVEDRSQLFFVILCKAVLEGGITAFEDETFKKPLTREAFKEKVSGGNDTTDIVDINDPEKITGHSVYTREFPIDSIYQFQIKEEVVFDKEASRLVTRILGISPMMPSILKGKIIDSKTYPKLWLYYPDIRAYLSKFDVYNPKNFANKMTWEDLFESRMFSSYIVKSTVDNPYDVSLFEKAGKNKLFALLEGEAIKEKIFNYEQDLWSY